MAHPDEFIRQKIRKAETQAQKLKSEHHELLWLPSKPLPKAPDSPDIKMFQTFLTWNDAFPNDELPSKKEFIKLIREFSGEDVLQFSAKLIFVYNDLRNRRQGLKLGHLKGFFESAVFERLNAIAKSRGSIPISKTNVIYIQHLALIHCHRTKGILVAGNEITFGKILMASAEYCEGESFYRESDSMEEKVKSFAGFTFRNLPFNRNEWLGGLFARYWYLARKITQGAPNPALVDLAVKFSIYMHYVKDDFEVMLKNPGDFLIGPDYFRHVKKGVRGRAKKTISAISKKWNGHRSALLKSEVKACGYNTRSFFEAPLYRFPSGSFFTMDSQILARHACTHFKFKLLESARKAGGPKGAAEFKGAWGKAFEAYVLEVLLPALEKIRGEKSVLIDGRDGYEGADVLVLHNKTAVILEFTSSSVPVLKQLSGDWKEIERSIDWIFLKTQDGGKGKVQQFIDLVERLQRGEIKINGKAPDISGGIFPVVIFEEMIPQVRPVITLMREKFAKAGLPGEISRNLELWDIEELEMSDEVFKDGVAAAIIEKREKGYADHPWKNFMSFENKNSKSAVVEKYFEDSTGELAKLLFKKKKGG